MIHASTPEQAPTRADLTFLRHRRKPAANPALAEFLTGGAGRDHHHSGAAAGAAPDRPAGPPTPARPPAATPDRGSGATSLDLGGPPAPAASTRSTAARTDTSLDLGGPAPTRPTAARTDTSLDLGGITRPPAAGAVVPAPPPVSREPVRSNSSGPPAGPARRRGAIHPRIRRGAPTILDRRSPTVALTRVQSGVGSLVLDLAVTASVGDLVMGAAYQLGSGLSSTVDLTAGRRTAPPGRTRRPLLLAGRGQFERISVDLRCSTDLERLVIYGSSASGTPLAWGGTLLVTTFGGDRVELPITLPAWDAAHQVAVLASVHNVAGEWVLRSEMNAVAPSIRDACRAYGFDRITWLDDHTPID
ncbi:hypothetical protein JL107_17340 [Nakamurella flavida]|uniref:Uncharacterized protein n=1 Tax=Nakamurella flavida TaxID=363630 RepID=A0A939C4L4_9ACTN|nr:hypothetical protein [Nakamurella flavida]MBM9478216.1 hypothetical protein [Nakamurella flavida]MDP9778562.1 hypothetical protein [Nakamurella flavida]